MTNKTYPNERTHWDMNIGPDGGDLDYQGSDETDREEKEWDEFE